MQWWLLAVWGWVAWRGTPRGGWAMGAAVWLTMATQLVLLHADGLLSVQTALPLHLCSLMGLLLPLLLWRAPPVLYEAAFFLGAPAALITLFFPAVIDSSHPVLMRLAFYTLHVLIAVAPLYLHQTKRPLPTDPRRTLVVGSGYMAAVGVANRLLGTNYLFLRAAPAHTPLALLMQRGTAFYVCALGIVCMAAFCWLAHFRKYVIM